MSIDRLRAEHGIGIRWAYFPLHPEIPEAGMAVADFYHGRDPEERKAASEHLRGAMAEAGLPFNSRTRLDNSRLAQELGAWADTHAGGEAIHHALYRAYFVENRCISDPGTLVEIARSVGLDAGAASQVLESRSCASKVDADWQRARAKGVAGVPTFHHGDIYLLGAQPYEALSRFVTHLRA